MGLPVQRAHRELWKDRQDVVRVRRGGCGNLGGKLVRAYLNFCQVSGRTGGTSEFSDSSECRAG